MSSPAGQVLLQGGNLSTYVGRLVRQVPGWLARLEPTSRVMANGFCMSLPSDQAEPLNVGVGNSLNCAQSNRVGRLTEQMCEALLQLQIFLHWNAITNRRAIGDGAVLSFKEWEQPAFHRKPCNLNRVARFRI